MRWITLQKHRISSTHSSKVIGVKHMRLKKSKISNNAQDMKDTYGMEMIDLAEKITGLPDIDKYTTVTLMNEPFKTDVLACVSIASSFCVRMTNGMPEIDPVMFEQLSNEDRIKELTGLLGSMESVTSTFITFAKAFGGFSIYIGNLLQHEKEKRDGGDRAT